ncbi:phage major capsid protein [Clostridium botulinum]|uniref:phage major capsid protein n=1 Tax=Clostridium botulinum TaxID=1491 RepID=UPI001C9A2F02|nr:phage major capsid protein [Clostridium botulinum]MBY6860807.1 phage major capsid protein [Clostridium botulinum]MBY7043804.1 phage major capsid protein [Clostridium botulinum]
MKKVQFKKILETRSLPPLVEEMNGYIEEMNTLAETVKTETRSLTVDEVTRVTELRTKVDNIKETLKLEEESRDYIMNPVKKAETEEKRSLEERNFVDFVRGNQRALDIGNNGGIIPQTIANKIIEKVKELSPIYRLSTIYNIGGDLIFPIYDDENSAITADYVEDLTELNESTGKFTTVKLTNYIVGCLAKISKSLINRQDFDLLSFVVDKVGQAIAEFMEKELITGTTKAQGLATVTNVTTANTLNADTLIDLQMEVKEVFQGKSVWIMHKDNLKATRKFKDGDGNYLLNKDLTNGFGWSILGKPVYITESCPQDSIYYGDMSGLYVKLTKNVELQLLLEKFATQHAVGCVGYVEFDSKIVEPQKLAALKIQGAKSKS